MRSSEAYAVVHLEWVFQHHRIPDHPAYDVVTSRTTGQESLSLLEMAPVWRTGWCMTTVLNTRAAVLR